MSRQRSDLATPLTPQDYGIPSKDRYYLSELAGYLCRVPDGASPEEMKRARRNTLRSLERQATRKGWRLLRVGRTLVVTAAELERIFAEEFTER